jgi:hypothetical protein
MYYDARPRYDACVLVEEGVNNLVPGFLSSLFEANLGSHQTTRHGACALMPLSPAVRDAQGA